MTVDPSAAAPALDTQVVRVSDLVDWHLAYLRAMTTDETTGTAADVLSGAGISHRLAFVLDEADDPVQASELLGYDVAGRHVALVIWSTSSQVSAADLVRLTQPLARLPGVGAVLAVPASSTTVVCWIGVQEAWTQVVTRLSRAVQETGDVTRVACGEPGDGLAGFRSSHRQAVAARRVAELPGSGSVRVTRYRDVAATSLLALQPQEAGPWVVEVLGDLAGPGEELARLRQTLTVYLSVGENASDAALRLYVHRNTVKYRVARALNLLAVPFERNRLNVALALTYYDQALGPD